MEAQYYALLPAHVRYSKNLSATEKLLYAEFASMADVKGCCSPTNKQIGDALGVKVRKVSASITALENAGFIKTFNDEYGSRYIKIAL